MGIGLALPCALMCAYLQANVHVSSHGDAKRVVIIVICLHLSVMLCNCFVGMNLSLSVGLL